MSSSNGVKPPSWLPTGVPLTHTSAKYSTAQNFKRRTRCFHSAGSVTSLKYRPTPPENPGTYSCQQDGTVTATAAGLEGSLRYQFWVFPTLSPSTCNRQGP